MYFIGYDLGSSSVKAALLDAKTNQEVGSASYPSTEMKIYAPQPGWAEQEPDLWWDHVVQVTQILLAESEVNPDQIIGIGISYQMHGLVVVDQEMRPLRPAIIWCDSRAIAVGEETAAQLGIQTCLDNLLNTPGNFTASKLKWVAENEPELYQNIAAFMLPGDYIVSKMTGQISSTISGYSEGILWDFKSHTAAEGLMKAMDIDSTLLPPLQPNLGPQGNLLNAAAEQLGLPANIPITYRAGDQPNNALSLGVVHPGEVAATGGTSGVVYGVLDQLNYDQFQRVNSFAHVNHTQSDPRIGVLLCINGAGISYAWMRQQFDADKSYDALAELVASVPIGSDGVSVLPFGNGAERMLQNKNIGSSIHFLDWNRHDHRHLYRATLEGIAFSYVYGMSILQELGIDISTMRVGNDNLFQSAPFAQTIATLMNCEIQVIQTNGAAGAARGAAIGLGTLTMEQAFTNLQEVIRYKPDTSNLAAYSQAYERWSNTLNRQINQYA